MKETIFCLTFFISMIASLQAMNNDAMEIDNSSPRNAQDHIKSVVFMAISSPIAQSQSLSAENNDASATNRDQSCQKRDSCDASDQQIDKVELDSAR